MLSPSCAVNFYNAGVVTKGRRIATRLGEWVIVYFGQRLKITEEA
jgi:hypothetical protein